MAFQEYSKTVSVKAEQVKEQRSVITLQGPVAAYPGQWEVRHSDGRVTVMDDDIFQKEWSKTDSKPLPPKKS